MSVPVNLDLKVIDTHNRLKQKRSPGEMIKGLTVRRMLVPFLAFFAFAFFLQWRAGALEAEFSGSDEAAHFVTALMIHDYVASGMPAAPVKYAEGYYVHYPKVTFGIWPPLFHLSQAAWILLFSPSRVSVLVLMAMWTALLATGCFAAGRREFGFWVAMVLGLLLISLPRIQESSSADMPDIMMTCFMWAATLAFTRYLELEKARDAVLFGVLASIAIMVKYNALCLALVPPFTLLINRRFDLLRRGSFWLPVPVVALLCGPWYIYNRNLVRYAMEPNPGIEDIPGAIAGNWATLLKIGGGAILALAVVGAVAMLRPRLVREKGQAFWVSAAALLAATWIFHSLLYPMDEPRYLLAVAPVLLVFMAAGCRWIAGEISEGTRYQRVAMPALLGFACAWNAAFTFFVPVKAHYGFPAATASLLREAAQHEQLVLVSGPAETEGLVISEMALADRKLRTFVLRGSKVLAHSSWMGKNYESLFQSPEQVSRFLKELPISTVIADRSYDRQHHHLLQAALAADPSTWVPVQMGNSDSIQIYRRSSASPLPVGPAVYLDLSRTVGRSLVVPQTTNPEKNP